MFRSEFSTLYFARQRMRSVAPLLKVIVPLPVQLP
jgi:hypothetical protein